MNRSDLKISILDLLDAELDGELSVKSRRELCDALVDRLDQDFGLLDLDDESDSEEEEE